VARKFVGDIALFRNCALFACALLGLSLSEISAFAESCSGQYQSTGTVLGAITGGVLGGTLAHSNASTAVGGALLGGLAGNAISHDMDCADRPYAARSYAQSFHSPVGERQEWRHGPDRAYVVSNREYRRGPEICRDFTQVFYRRGHELTRDGTACRDAKADDWHFR